MVLGGLGPWVENHWFRGLTRLGIQRCGWPLYPEYKNLCPCSDFRNLWTRHITQQEEVGGHELVKIGLT